MIEDRTNQLSGWVDVVHLADLRAIEVYGYANNHYEGFAPATNEKFRNLQYAIDVWSPNLISAQNPPSSIASSIILRACDGIKIWSA